MKSFLLILSFFSSIYVYAEEKSKQQVESNFWHGHQLHLDAVFTVFIPVSSHGFVEARDLWWLDRFITGDLGIHDAYFTVGGGIRF